MAKKKLKHPTKRKPRETLSLIKMIEEVALETGFHKRDVDEVLRLMTKKMREALLEKKQVYLEGIGGIFPFLYRGRTVNNLRGGEGETIELPSRYRARFQPSTCLNGDLERVYVSHEDVEDMYEE